MRTKYYLIIFLIILSMTFFISCGDDDDDDSPTSGDDDVTDDDDDDTVDEVIPTTLDLTFTATQYQNKWVMAQGPGEPHMVRNDLGVSTSKWKSTQPLSMAYFITMSDLHQTDEESPTRLTFYDSLTILGGMFDAAFRPQEDLAPQLVNALVRTANRIQEDYERDFDFALMLGDATDNAQINELKLTVDVLDGSGLTSGEQGWARPDSGDLDMDPGSGLNRGERDFGIQEFDGQGDNINAFERDGYPNSNADFPVDGLRKSDGSPVPWFAAIGNHDALNTGNFDPTSFLTFFTEEDYVSGNAPFGFIPGLGATIEFWQNNPDVEFYISGGIFGWGLEWSFLLNIFNLVGLVPDDYSVDIDERFDLETLVGGTYDDPSDDGVTITPDDQRAFLGLSGIIDILNGAGHGFADNNNDGKIDQNDGGYYRVDWSDFSSGLAMPLRILVMDTTDAGFLEGGGFSEAQLDWLEEELEHAIQDKVLVILASHHYENATEDGIERFQELLWDCPNVFLHLVGHGHDNSIKAHKSPDDDPSKGFWEVQTPSCIEFPQQMNIIEVVDNRDGSGSIYFTLFDHWQIEGDDSDILAELGKELAFTDAVRMGYPIEGRFGGSGLRADRNQQLIFAIPIEVAARLSAIESEQPVTSTDSLGTKYKGSYQE